MEPIKALVLKRNEERRLRAGHLWIFSNEVDTQASPLTAFQPGERTDVVDSRGKALGTVLVNPHSLICARLISRRPGCDPSVAWFRRRLDAALALRQRAVDGDCYRLVHGEADGLPGLIVDRFGDVLVGQLNTAGMDRLRSRIEEALMERLSPTGILWRNDSRVRELEGLAREVVSGPGRIPDRIEVREAGLRFGLELAGGQKTGWYFDQQANRARVAPLLGRCERVLDLYSYHGAWGLVAAANGARQVECIDSSAPAIAAVQANAEANGLSDRVSALQGDAEKIMDACLAEKRRFDAVIVDPPAFAPRARDVKPALKAYRRLNEKAMRLVEPGGLLISMSCSAHVQEDRYEAILLQAARHIDRELQVLMRLEQGPDHPVHPAIAETRYLKGRAVRVLPSF
ncbi:class I SAM-dependent rRNA methyltransferase [Wenzhouxiangella marina]|uniref:SAM-dependent methyltransferase n=1 Tax=Wenzhouxiangella marina TaxID=1579979 RepID=A0A0K0XSX5_9GAMM|nr:class I SAM-dependent rRNA methyltransferase [Wenzhouxiangella marina]AKS40722.1 SAM-dependent methyltransferase [Wenzhouxiangella marina]MBB6087595.1 23S rRNA (cytosine1962-C5)-methyltransferase [Wenzhouxiangella marina]